MLTGFVFDDCFVVDNAKPVCRPIMNASRGQLVSKYDTIEDWQAKVICVYI